MTPDPAGMAAADPANPQTWNRYAYVMNNPLAYIDPLGLGSCDPDGTCHATGSAPCPDGSMYMGGPCVDIPGFLDFFADVFQFLGANNIFRPQVPFHREMLRLPAALAKNSTTQTITNNGNCTASSGTTSIMTGNVTTNGPTIAAGALIGEWTGGPPGAFLGGILGSFFGVGGTVSYVPSSNSLYTGPTLVFAPAVMGGNGISGTVSSVPASQNPNSIASGWDFSVTFQPNPILGSTVVKSPGSGPPVVGPSVGTRVPVSFGISYSFPVKKGGC